MIGWMRFTLQFLLYTALFWAIICILLGADKACAQGIEIDERGPSLILDYDSPPPPRRPLTKAEKLALWDMRFWRDVQAMCFYFCNPATDYQRPIKTKIEVKEPAKNFGTHTPAKVVTHLVKLGGCDNIVLGEFNALTVEHVLSCLPEKGDFSIVVDGPGSRVIDLLQLLQGISTWRAKGHKLTCQVKDEADSGNAYFFESAECDTREIYVSGKIGIHHVVMTITKADLSLVELQALVKGGTEMENFLYRMVARRIDGGIGSDGLVDVLRKLVEGSPDGLLVFTSWQALGIGLADRVVRQ